MPHSNSMNYNVSDQPTEDQPAKDYLEESGERITSTLDEKLTDGTNYDEVKSYIEPNVQGQDNQSDGETGANSITAQKVGLAEKRMSDPGALDETVKGAKDTDFTDQPRGRGSKGM